MADPISWIIIISVDVFSILLGLYCGSKLLHAFLDRKDMMKYQGYLVMGFILILVFPVIFTSSALKFVDAMDDSGISIAFKLNIQDVRGENDLISVKTEEDKAILSIDNYLDDVKPFSISVSCAGNNKNCDSALGSIVPKYTRVNVEPTITLEVPIMVYIKDDIPEGDYEFNIDVKNEDGSVYDTVPVKFSVE